MYYTLARLFLSNSLFKTATTATAVLIEKRLLLDGIICCFTFNCKTYAGGDDDDDDDGGVIV
jgi:hypothetical protein